MTTQNKDLIDRIDVREPCTESWDEMTGNDKVRFCSHCAKNVYDISAYTRERAEKLVRDSAGGLCVRYRKDDRGRVVTAPPRFTQIKRHAKIAASVLATTLSVASMAYSQGSPIVISDEAKVEKRDKEESNSATGFTISGVVKDMTGAIVAGADVRLFKQEKQINEERRSSSSGVFSFAYLDAGRYDLEVSSPGFKKSVIKNLQINSNLRSDIILEVEMHTEFLMGVVGYSDEDLIVPSPVDEISTTISLPNPSQLPLHSRSPMVLVPVEKPEAAKKSKKKLPK